MSRKSKKIYVTKTCPVHAIELGYIRARLGRIEKLVWGLALISIGKILFG